MSKKIIAVVGATGAQGGGLVRAAIRDGVFAVRAITRNTKSDKAQALAALGAEVVAADIDNAAAVRQAFRGTYAAFCITNFWEHFSPEKELSQALVMAEAAKAENVGHVIWSTLEDTRRWVPVNDTRMPTLQGKYKVPHFDAKGEADRLFAGLNVPTTFLATSFYWDNLIHFGMGPKKGQDGKLAFVLPMADKKLPGIAAEDIGKCAYSIIKGRETWIGKTVGIAGEHLTGAEMAAALGSAFGQSVAYSYVTPEVYRTFGFPGAGDMANMFQFKRDFERVYCGARDLGVSRYLNTELQTFSQWLVRNKERIPLG